MSVNDLSQAKNPDLLASVAAMQHAAQEARDIAIQFNTGIVVEDNDGNILHIDAETLRKERDEQRAKGSPSADPTTV
ncbi:hypothetical protein [Bordetella sp. LUAb4]|uniref:hypothetical protein n=1 Tax=Bordetella sp. LUAb4 TaxID=2843195 RepID=UPI001E595213|nr:hypothetical protein [Bordetella sp. LUAb4]